MNLNLRAVAATALALLSSPAGSAELGDARRGRDYAEAACAQCHSVKPAEMVSPRLEATPFSVLARAPGLNETALGMFLQPPTPKCRISSSAAKIVTISFLTS